MTNRRSVHIFASLNRDDVAFTTAVKYNILAMPARFAGPGYFRWPTACPRTRSRAPWMVSKGAGNPLTHNFLTAGAGHCPIGLRQYIDNATRGTDSEETRAPRAAPAEERRRNGNEEIRAHVAELTKIGELEGGTTSSRSAQAPHSRGRRSWRAAEAVSRIPNVLVEAIVRRRRCASSPSCCITPPAVPRTHPSLRNTRYSYL